MAKKKASKTTRFMVRQGDVILVREDGLKSGKEVAPQGDRIILAIGETSGHCHAIDASRAKLYDLAQESVSVERAIDRMLEVMHKATMRVEATSSRARMDERHTPIDLPAGTYRVRVMREYDPQMVRSVAD